MNDLLEESRALMPGKARSHWMQESKTPVFNPYGMGMWVIRVEDYLYKVTGKKWTWKKPILTIQGGKKIQYKWATRKKRGALVPALFTMTVEYKKGPDAFEIETAYFDGSNIVASKTHHDVYIEQAVDPEVLFGWVRHKWNKKTGMKAEGTERPERSGAVAVSLIKNEGKASFDDLKSGLLDYLKGGKQISVAELSYAFQGGSAKIEKYLASLVKQGKLKKVRKGRKMLYSLAEGAPGPFAVSDNPPTIQDQIDAVREQIRNPSWTYPSWALPKVQLDETE